MIQSPINPPCIRVYLRNKLFSERSTPKAMTQCRKTCH